MKAYPQKIENIEEIVSALNNYMEEHAYLFEGDYYGEEADIVSNYGFGYVDNDDRIYHWVEGSDIEVCSLTQQEIIRLIGDGLTDETIVYIMDQCSCRGGGPGRMPQVEESRTRVEASLIQVRYVLCITKC